MVTTGYSDTFGRTVSGGLGTANSGQAYTLFGTASQFSVAPNTASIAIATAGDKLGYIDLQTANVDITAQVALSAIPATNLATAGFVAKLSTTSNYYNATMLVAAGGAVSLRFSKVIAGGLVTISTTSVPGVTYVANTFYNLRYQISWSRALQTNVMNLMLWAVGNPQPGGWMATATDASLTDYTSGTQVGIMGRDESTAVGSITTKYRSVLARSYNLPMPALTDPMCYDPAVTYPQQTALRSLADAADAATLTLDPLASLAALFPRVRVSASNAPVKGSQPSLTFDTTEFNIGTSTNLGYDNAGIYLPIGIWLVSFEIQLAEAASTWIQLSSNGSGGPAAGRIVTDMRSNAAHSNDAGAGGCGHFTALTYSTDPTTPVRYTVGLSSGISSTLYTATYMALSAVKISDYFS
jgi:hypothetical protein